MLATLPYRGYAVLTTLCTYILRHLYYCRLSLRHLRWPQLILQTIIIKNKQPLTSHAKTKRQPLLLLPINNQPSTQHILFNTLHAPFDYFNHIPQSNYIPYPNKPLPLSPSVTSITPLLTNQHRLSPTHLRYSLYPRLSVTFPTCAIKQVPDSRVRHHKASQPTRLLP
ncbi:hypothetical protein M426DRAFT_94442 [Hypoxylon sp. CI-4A]|nr:hypothetical protein M426DRAFT_94442 [Hypoxylon sp. CI-4A]